MSVDWFLICFCMEAIFANIQNALIFGILGVLESGGLHRIAILCL